MIMTKTPAEYAETLLNLGFGDREAAMVETFNAARAYPAVPAKFFKDVYEILASEKEKAA